MKSPKISIVVPSYNKVRFISQTLESIVKQEYENLEVIIQDGGSTDGTVEIIKKFAKKYPKIFKFESKKDKGQLDAISKGLNKTTGEILTYINADDFYIRGAFEDVAKAYKNSPNAFWFAGRGSVIDSEGREIAKAVTLYKNFFLNLNSLFFLLVTNYLMQPSVFITRKAFEKYGQFTGIKEFVTEYDLWLKISKDQMPVIINKTLSKFRIEEGTKTKQMSKKLLAEDEKIVKQYTNNSLIIFLHNLHNKGRLLIDKFI